MPDAPQEEKLFGALFRIPFQRLDRRIEQGLIDSGYTDLSPAHFEVFRHMDPGGSRSTTLADRAHITKQSMGYLVDYLQKHGYVVRVPDPADRRAKLVQLTDKGQAVNQTALHIIQQAEQEWAQQLGIEKMKQLRDLLTELITILERSSTCAIARHEE